MHIFVFIIILVTNHKINEIRQFSLTCLKAPLNMQKYTTSILIFYKICLIKDQIETTETRARTLLTRSLKILQIENRKSRSWKMLPWLYIYGIHHSWLVFAHHYVRKYIQKDQHLNCKVLNLLTVRDCASLEKWWLIEKY